MIVFSKGTLFVQIVAYGFCAFYFVSVFQSKIHWYVSLLYMSVMVLSDKSFSLVILRHTFRLKYAPVQLN